MSEDAPEGERVYPIRIMGPAAADIEQAAAYLGDLVGQAFVGEWEDGLYEAIRTLATMPGKHPVAERESRHFGIEVRLLLYERRRGGPAYRVLFTIVQEGDDPPFVRILHVRHGARRPITRTEAQERLRAIEES